MFQDKFQIKPLRSKWLLSSFKRCLDVLSRGEKKKLSIIIFLQLTLGMLDLLGVAAIGLLGALSVAGLNTGSANQGIYSVLRILQLSEESLQFQFFAIGTIAVLLLVSRTALSVYFTRKIIFFMSRTGAALSAQLVSRLLSQSLLQIQTRTNQETLYAVTTGVTAIVLQVLATSAVLVSDYTLLFFLGIGLLIVDPLTALGIFVLFAITSLILYLSIHARASDLGSKISLLSIKSSTKIIEVLISFRESVVSNRRDFQARQIRNLRLELANSSAEQAFMPYISKYVIEASVILGALIVGLMQFLAKDVAQAIAALSIFLAAGSRIAPAALRIQQGTLQVRSGLGAAKPTLSLIDSLQETPIPTKVMDSLASGHDGFVPEIQISEVTFAYPSQVKPAIDKVSLKILPGSSVAIVGPSGAGKTTLIDVLLGVLNPDSGKVLVSGVEPLKAISKWPGAISYVPQDVLISAGTIRENVAYGFPASVASDDQVMSSLKIAHLDDFCSGLPQGIDTHVGERGALISGGQRQRLGIARAMFTRPLLIVLDEATSSLDGETESKIAATLRDLHGSTTVVVIAHRLSTLRNVDQVVYLAGGQIVSVGSFDEVRREVPDFDYQAKLMGL